jgi:hypothetical protein
MDKEHDEIEWGLMAARLVGELPDHERGARFVQQRMNQIVDLIYRAEKGKHGEDGH